MKVAKELFLVVLILSVIFEQLKACSSLLVGNIFKSFNQEGRIDNLKQTLVNLNFLSIEYEKFVFFVPYFEFFLIGNIILANLNSVL